eukprot:CAMPEP_0206222834 /NCGR_PEP_ID=MMETSP0047_2-20121206/6168_1 /ASSEMBLY_ACC=CAM_ASM_000192 /TAXON_ID=195065 /ORGANISM="Chroomonas mesostigmatica_cf, Strain CCMP1168" /LENGTH=317 /DNA_ID=CAMNT_0053645679 /DNA_START=17 /DNA_END=970 /DNA_ORIENTATION=-
MGGKESKPADDSWSNVDQCPRLDGKVCIVTGANSGLGLEQAKAMYRKGAAVVLACRSQERANKARDEILAATPAEGGAVGSAEVILCDLSDLDSVRAFASKFKSKYTHLHILVNNAGIMAPSKRQTNKNGWEMQFCCNHLGHFLLTSLLLPELIASKPSRIVNVASMAHAAGNMDFSNIQADKSYSSWGQYGMTKLSNLLFTYELSKRLSAKHPEVVVAAAHPGWTTTGLQNNENIPFHGVFNAVMGQGTKIGVLPQLYASCSDQVKQGSYYGPAFVGIWGASTLVKAKSTAYNEEHAKKLWELSMHLTEASFKELE